MHTAKRTLLVYGATGKAGSLIVEKALAKGWTVSAFVRNPSKVPPQTASRVTVIKGDLSDGAAVASAVKQTRPTVIIDASSALPIGHAKGQPANDADRSVILKATVSALEEDQRLDDCVVLIISGQLVPEPGGTINSFSIAALAWILRTMVARKAWRKMEESIRWLFEGTPKTFRFVYARMGTMVQEPSRGKLFPEPTENNIQRGKASYDDVANAFIELAADETRQWERKPIFFNYRVS